MLEGRPHRRAAARTTASSTAALRIAHPELNNVIYGHAIEANGRLWLQYWLWYFYNDYQLSFALGTHEGDWEMVQLRMDAEAGHPDVAVYAQHRYGEVRPWDEVETLGDRPVVYVARGSHASYFEAGFHQTEAWYDLADGKRRMKHRPALEILEHRRAGLDALAGALGRHAAAQRRRVQQPDRAGRQEAVDRARTRCSTTRRGDVRGAARAPRRRRCGRCAPAAGCASSTTSRSAQPRPHDARRDGELRGRGRVPPQTHNIAVHSGGHGKVTTDIVLDPLKRYDVHTSTIAGDPPVPSESTRDDIAPFGADTPRARRCPQRALRDGQQRLRRRSAATAAADRQPSRTRRGARLY